MLESVLVHCQYLFDWVVTFDVSVSLSRRWLARVGLLWLGFRCSVGHGCLGWGGSPAILFGILIRNAYDLRLLHLLRELGQDFIFCLFTVLVHFEHIGVLKFEFFFLVHELPVAFILFFMIATSCVGFCCLFHGACHWDGLSGRE